MLDRDPDGAGHRRLAAAAEREAVDRGDHRLAEILDEIEHLLAEAAGLLRFDRASTCASSLMSAPAMNALSPAPVRMTPRTAASSRASSKAVRRSGQVGVFSALSTFGPIDRHIGDGALLLVEHVRERRAPLASWSLQPATVAMLLSDMSIAPV